MFVFPRNPTYSCHQLPAAVLQFLQIEQHPQIQDLGAGGNMFAIWAKRCQAESPKVIRRTKRNKDHLSKPCGTGRTAWDHSGRPESLSILKLSAPARPARNKPCVMFLLVSIRPDMRNSSGWLRDLFPLGDLHPRVRGAAWRPDPRRSGAGPVGASGPRGEEGQRPTKSTSPKIILPETVVQGVFCINVCLFKKRTQVRAKPLSYLFQ